MARGLALAHSSPFTPSSTNSIGHFPGPRSTGAAFTVLSDAAQSVAKTSANALATGSSATRAPSSWMCDSARQSRFWLPSHASRSSTTMNLACWIPPAMRW